MQHKYRGGCSKSEGLHFVLLDLKRLQHERVGERHAAGVKKAFGLSGGIYLDFAGAIMTEFVLMVRYVWHTWILFHVCSRVGLLRTGRARAADGADVEAGREWLHAFLCACIYLWAS